MYKTVWMIKSLTENITTELTWYHLGKEPKFPSWYMEESKAYEIEMIWNFKLIYTPKLFFRCLTHFYKIK